MISEVIINRILGSLLLPPIPFLMLIFIGYYQRKTWLFILGCFLTYYSSTPHAAIKLSEYLYPNPLNIQEVHKAQAVVILGGGKRPAPEYLAFGVAETLTSDTNTRVIYGTYLSNKLKLPILVSGGNPMQSGLFSEAYLMAKYIRETKNTHVRWVEDFSNTTNENALLSSRLLKNDGVRTILLVTDANHMNRAKEAFESNGLNVIPAATSYIKYEDPPLLLWVPKGRSMQEVYSAMHEIIGRTWYNLRSLIDSKRRKIP
jgi:uncharacterized SAM-binding protein YcdF (DUF218 family)